MLCKLFGPAEPCWCDDDGGREEEAAAVHFCERQATQRMSREDL